MSSLKRTALTGCTTVYVSSLCYTGCSIAAQRPMMPSVLFSTALHGVSMLRTVCARWEPWPKQCLETWRSAQSGRSVNCTYRPMCTSRHSTFCAHSIGMGYISCSQYNRTTFCASFPSLGGAYRRRSGWRPQRQNFQTTQYRGEGRLSLDQTLIQGAINIVSLPLNFVLSCSSQLTILQSLWHWLRAARDKYCSV